MATLDWSLPLCTQHDTPFIGRVLENCPVHDRRRVGIFPPSVAAMPHYQPDEKKVTVFRYAEDGRTRGDGAPSENDLVNYDPEDGGVRINTDGCKILCARKAA